MQSGELNKEKLKTLLKHNANVLDPTAALYLLDGNILTQNDFRDCGIDDEFTDLLDEDKPTDPASGSDFHRISKIEPGVTEVYFWGVPESGKTCVLGALMSMAKNGSDYMYQHPCQGGDYMSRLTQVFQHHGVYTFLPKGTDVYKTFEMRFSITRQKKEHPISLIDMSGELFTCLYKKWNNIPLSDYQEPAYETLENILVKNNSGNRKVHFFVIEYGAHQKRFEGLTQSDYLQRAVEHLNALGVFREYTDAIYIILTKADKAGIFEDDMEERMHFKNYMSQHYRSFYFYLKKEICVKYSINAGELEFVPFSIGEVAFKKLCHFDSRSAREILDYIIERSFYVEKNALGRVVRILRK